MVEVVGQQRRSVDHAGSKGGDVQVTPGLAYGIDSIFASSCCQHVTLRFLQAHPHPRQRRGRQQNPGRTPSWSS